MVMSTQRTPQIEDLKHLECFICREEEDRSNKQPSQLARKWVHPCTCKLVAHESCLLSWISQSQSSNPDKGEENALRCPQCKARYVIDSDNPLTLKIFDYFNRLLSKWGKYVTLGSLVSIVIASGSGVYVLFSIYGEYALYQFLGPEAFEYLLGDDWLKWPWHAWINVPLIPIYLLFSRTKFFSSYSTWWCIFLAPQYTHISPDKQIDLTHLASWPPHPMWLPILSPAIHGLYAPFREYLTRKILKIDKPPERRARRYLWDLEAFQGRLEIDFQDRDDPPEGINLANNNENIDNDNQEGQPNGANAAEGAQERVIGDGEIRDPNGAGNEAVIRITPYSMGRVIASALMIPTISKWMGSLLYRCATGFRLYSLQRFLGIKPFRVSPKLLTILDGFSDLDAVYWRNTVGLGLYLVASDCISLFHVWMKHRELNSRRIRNRNFAGVDPSDLDLLPASSS